MQACEPSRRTQDPTAYRHLVMPDCKQASSGLAGLGADAPSPSGDPAVLNLAGFVGYDDLVKAKGILDLIVKLPSFDAELGKITLSSRIRRCRCCSVAFVQHAACEYQVYSRTTFVQYSST